MNNQDRFNNADTPLRREDSTSWISLGTSSCHSTANRLAADVSFSSDPELGEELIDSKQSKTRPQPLAVPNSKLTNPRRFKAEEPKSAVSNSRLVAVRRCFIHLAPVAISLGLLILNFRTYFCAALNNDPDSNTVLGVLQFAAKLHELLIISSLTSIVLHKIQYDLSHVAGVPLGFLTAAFNISDPTYFFSKEFYGSAARPEKGRKSRTVSLALTVTIGAILSAVAGPASAIAMLPSLNWWPVPFVLFDRQVQAYVATDIHTLWSTLPHGCEQVFAICEMENDTDCAPDGYMTMLDFVQQGLSPSQPVNTTVLIPQTKLSRVMAVAPLTASGAYSSPSYSYVASTGMNFVATELGYLWENILDAINPSWDSPYGDSGLPGSSYLSPGFYSSSINIKTSLQDNSGHPHLYKPLVQVECVWNEQAYGLNDSGSDIQLPHKLLELPPWNYERQNTWSIPGAFIKTQPYHPNSAFSQFGMQFQWVDYYVFGNSSSYNDTHKILAATLSIEDGWDNLTTSGIAACTVDARWIPTEHWITPRMDSIMHDTYTDPIELLSSTVAKNSLPIRVDSEWAGLLDVPVPGNNTNQTTLTSLLSPCLYTAWRGTAECVAAVLSVTLAEGLSRSYDAGIYDQLFALSNHSASEVFGQSFLHPWPADDLPDVSNGSLYSPYNLEASQFGYGYNMSGITSFLSAAVLLLYSFIALVHMTLVIYGGWTSSSWKTIGELLVLAINSIPTERLRNTSAGVANANTWREIVKVCEMKENELDLVFDGGLDFGTEIGGLPRPNKKYGSVLDLKGTEIKD